MAVLQSFSVDDLVAMSDRLRGIGAGADSMAAAAQNVCDYLFENLLDVSGGPACAFVRTYKTHLHRALPPELAAVAARVDPSTEPTTPAMVLLASAPGGIHAMPVEDRELVNPLTARAFDEAPLILRLLDALGVDRESVFDPSRAITMRLHHKTLNVFVERDLATSEWIPDADDRKRIAEFGINTLIGLGSVLPNGDLLLVTLFTFSPIDDRTADLLRSLGLAARAALIPHTFRPFAPA